MSSQIKTNAKPFLKWAGGKRQLMDQLVARLPLSIIKCGKIDTYVEPFIGGGSFFFYLKSNFEIKRSVIMDINPDLILAYKTIQSKTPALIKELQMLEEMYSNLSLPEQEVFFYEKRNQYNTDQKKLSYDIYSKEWIERTAQLIFLNRTCFNGLFRQNKKGEYNVPFGRYLNPKICDRENLLEVAKALQNTEIICGDFLQSEKFIHKESLVYLDPPYRPIKLTSSFTNYSKEGFTDIDQARLATYYAKMHRRKALLILSNSNPKNMDQNDNFFEILYKKFHITEVSARRNINSKSSDRGNIGELMITNFLVAQ